MTEAGDETIRVLSVDDSAFSRQAVRVVLDPAGYEVVDAGSGAEALEILEGSTVAILVCDLDLPGDPPPPDLIEQAVSLHPGLQAIALTPRANDADIPALLRRRTVAVVPKPFEKEDFLGVIEDAAEMRDLGSLEVRAASPAWVELAFPSHHVYIRRVAGLLEQLEADLPAQEREHLVYAFVEMAQNAVEHGNELDIERRVRTSWYRLPDHRILRVTDEGDGFDPATIPHALGTDEKDPGEVARVRESMGLRPGGLGIASASRIADRLLYNEAGNAVVIIRRIPDGSAETSGDEG